MDLMRKEALEEMLRNGRAYRHEIQSIAHELLERRAGKDPTAFDGVTILVPRTLLVEGYYSTLHVRSMQIGQTKLIQFEPTYKQYIYTAIHRMPPP